MRTELLEVGARLMVSESHGWHGRRHKPGTVKRKTPKGIVTVAIDAYLPHGTIAHDVVFNPDGHERGNRYGRMLVPLDQKVLDQEISDAAVEKIRRTLENHAIWRTLPEDKIRKVYEIVRSKE